jgi:hypothetical protein
MRRTTIALAVVAALMANGATFGAPLNGVAGQVGTIGDIIGWLFTPLSGSSEHHIAMAIAWHGRLMVLGMGFLMPIVVIVARFYKITPQQDWPRQLDNPFWFVTHRRWGYAIGAIVAGGLACVLASERGGLIWDSLHTALGWLVIVLVAIQVASAYWRGTHGGPVDPFTRQRRPPVQWPGDHFSMTRRRIVFEYVHKIAGYALLAATLVAIPSGLVAVDAPRWMPIAMVLWWIVVLGVFVWLQVAGRCADTYQAIWGIEPDLPGNHRRRPIGIGIVRRSADGKILRGQ